MALLHAEAKDLTVPDLVMGIATEIYTRNPLMQVIPWIGTGETSYDYNREETNPTAAFAAEDGALTSGAFTVARKTATLKSLYVQNDISGFAQATVRRQDPRSILIMKMAKSLSEKIKDASINGTGLSNEFPGLEKLVTDESRDDIGSASANGDAISFTLLRTLLDAVHEASAILASPRTVRSVKALYDALGAVTPMMVMAGGYKTIAFEDVPIIPIDNIGIADTQGTTTDATKVYAIRTGVRPGLEDEGLAFIYADRFPLGYKAVDLGALEDKDNDRLRLMQYMSMVTHSTLAVGALKGITN